MPRLILKLCLISLVFNCLFAVGVLKPQYATASTVLPTAKQTTSELIYPISRGSERVTKKPFGIFVSPKNSPVSPERFSGYHAGIDFEIFPQEQNKDVPVYAVCAGKIIFKNWVRGYGGVVVEFCKLNQQPVTVLYGHLRLASIVLPKGKFIATGQKIGVLGNGYSKETDGERKHLHFGVHKGANLDLRGYVHRQRDLSSWLDPVPYLH